MSKWFVCCPDNGVYTYDTEQKAREHAHELMKEHASEAHEDYWHPEIASLCWGRLDVREEAKLIRSMPSENSSFDDVEEWDLRPVTDDEDQS